MNSLVCPYCETKFVDAQIYDCPHCRMERAPEITAHLSDIFLARYGSGSLTSATFLDTVGLVNYLIPRLRAHQLDRSSRIHWGPVRDVAVGPLVDQLKLKELYPETLAHL